MGKGSRAKNNRTVTLSLEDKRHYRSRLLTLKESITLDQILNTTINQDLFYAVDLLPRNSVDLLFIDPPYNLTKKFRLSNFRGRSLADYQNWFQSWFTRLLPVLTSTASVYVCGDWRSSTAIHQVLAEYLVVRNRITWQREKGRGAKANWKNNSEDIWFATVSDEYTFNVDAVKLRKQVIAPYRDNEGKPKDWQDNGGKRFRLTHPSNIWTDLTVPFWSMPENTEHPTQKPEKLLAKVILASSNPGEVVLDPFLGSGTTSVVAKKFGRRYIGIEIDTEYCCIAEKRLDMVDADASIQGYVDDVFWERNTLALQRAKKSSKIE